MTYYLYKKGRPEAVRALYRTLEAASVAIMAKTATLYDAPRPYPAVREPGAYWVYFAPYWIAFRRPQNPIISAVFYDAADIPNRIE